MNAKLPRCGAINLCPMTMGYYVGGGQYICWLHAIKLGIMATLRKMKLQPIALRGFDGF